MTVYLRSISLSLGDVRQDVAVAHAAGTLLSSVDELRRAGFAHHYVCSPDATSYDLARAAVAPIARNRPPIGAIVYATTLPCNATIGDDADFRRTADVKYLMRYPAARIQAEFGWSDAFVVGVGQQACTGLLGALRIAHALLLTDPDIRAALCLTADRFPVGASYEQAYNLVSDGAVACVLSLEGGPFELLGVHHITNGGMELASDDQTVANYFPFTIEAIRTVCRKADVQVGELDWVVMQNTHAKVAPILGRMLGLPEERMFSGTAPDVGHLIAGDALMNLDVLHRNGSLQEGQLVAVPIAGYGLNWQCALFRVTQDAA